MTERSDRPYVVQFPHQGGEHRPRGEEMDWNRGPHHRKFLKATGTYLDAAGVQRGPVTLWGEWEPQSRVVESYPPGLRDGPRWLHEPWWEVPGHRRPLQNTDPSSSETASDTATVARAGMPPSDACRPGRWCCSGRPSVARSSSTRCSSSLAPESTTGAGRRTTLMCQTGFGRWCSIRFAVPRTAAMRRSGCTRELGTPTTRVRHGASCRAGPTCRAMVPSPGR